MQDEKRPVRQCCKPVQWEISESSSASTDDDIAMGRNDDIELDSNAKAPDCPEQSDYDLSDEDSTNEQATEQPQEPTTNKDEEASEGVVQCCESTAADRHNHLHLHPRVEVGGFIYSRRKIYGDKDYYYCVQSNCPAGFCFSSRTRLCVPNGKSHNHQPMDLLANQLKGNLQEINLRKFVEANYHTASRHIYSMLLKEQEQHPDEYPRVLSVKIIQNVKGQIAGEQGRHLLDPTLPPDLEEIDGMTFLQHQAVRPVTLVFATAESLASIRRAQMIFLLRLCVKSSLLNHVYCVYAVDSGQMMPCIWFAFQRMGSLTWTSLRDITVSNHADPIRWVIPWSEDGHDIVDWLLRKCDRLVGVNGAYERKIDDLVARVTDKELRKSLADELKGLSALPITDIVPAVSRLKQQATDKNVVNVMSEWERLFARNTMWYHKSNCCDHAAVITEYKKQQESPIQDFTNDIDVIRTIHKHYHEYYQAADDIDPP